MTEKAVIKFYKENKDAITPTIAYNNTSACFDLYSLVDVIIEPKEHLKIPNGIRLIIPFGYYLRFCTRSSLGYIDNILVYPGVLDASYTGNLDVKLYNLGNKPIRISKGQKYAQVEVLKLPQYELQEIDEKDFSQLQQEYTKNGRGEKGWGSTGK